MQELQSFTRTICDKNGNGRVICHYSNIAPTYAEALRKARSFGRKYHNKKYGGGIIFQSNGETETQAIIDNLFLSDAERIGYKLIELLGLKTIIEDNDLRVRTSGGTKSPVGLYLTVQRLFNDKTI